MKNKKGKTIKEAWAEAHSPENLDAVLEWARSLAEQQEWLRASEVMRTVVIRRRRDVDLWLEIASCQRSGGRAEDALATLRRAIELNALDEDRLPTLWIGLVEHLCEAQQWAQAAEAALQGVRAARAAASTTRYLASLLAQGGADQQAKMAAGCVGDMPPFVPCFRIEPSRLREHELLELLATARAHEGRFEEAGEAMRALLMLSPRDPLHRMRLASLLQSHGALGEASREFERVMEMAPNTFFARDAEAGLDLMDKAQIQQILTRAAEQRSFGLRLERDLDGTLETHSFYLSQSGRESLRQMIDDGRPDLSGAPKIH